MVQMPSKEFASKRNALLKELMKSDELTEELQREIIDVYGTRGRKAIEAIKGGRVFKRGDRWFVRGRTEEYEVVRTFCSCRDYALNIVTEKAGVDMCYHALAKTICELLNAHYLTE
jgi:predicted nucleic acid-binding Zn finger protein